MIKLERPAKPDDLAKNEDRLREQYRDDIEKKKKDKNKKVTAVWREEYITSALSEMSCGKCAYCEKEADPLEVEHYFCKHKYSERVVDWTNLLPVCHRCNTQKSAHDCEAEPIIDPTVDNPKEHLSYDNFRFSNRNESQKGECTIAYLRLWDTDASWKRRKAIYEDVDERIEDCIYRLNHLAEDKPVYKEILRNKIGKLYKLAHISHEYSAIYATEILKHPHYGDLKRKLKESGIWAQDRISQLEKEANKISLAK